MKALILLLLCFVVSTQLFGQAAVPSNPDTGQGLKKGFVYFGFYKFSPNWGLHTDLQFRMDERVKLAEQTLLRAALIRYLEPNLSLFAGYAHINTHSNSSGSYFAERRSWQQLSYWHARGNLTLSYRFRTEQRFVEKMPDPAGTQPGADRFNYGNRVRIYTRAIYPIRQNPDARNVFYLAAQNEVFLNVASPDLNRNLFDQNRLLLAIGHTTNQHTRFELGYARVLINPYRKSNIQIHGLSLAVIQTIDFWNLASSQ